MTLSEPGVAGNAAWWIEGRPAEGGRQVLVHAALERGQATDAIPEGWSARTRVHEYGGGAYVVVGRGMVFSNDADGRLYRIEEGAQPRPITPEPAEPRALRYADMVATPDLAAILAVRESHPPDGGEPVNDLVAIPSEGGRPAVVAGGADFYSSPRVSPDGRRIAWLQWDHPQMPWDGTELWTADIDGSGAERVAGGPEESIFQPEWSPDGRLHWVSDRTGWWNLYREGDPLHVAEAEFGVPQWVFGLASYRFLADGRIACTWSSGGFSHLGLLDPGSGELEELDLEYLPISGDPQLRSDGRNVAYIGASPTRAPAVVLLDTASRSLRVIRRSAGDEPDPAYLSQPEAIEYDSHGRTAHALFYPPASGEFEGPPGERPPLIVISHGGPTGQTGPELDLRTQFWTSRGFAVVDVNYGGSTGYGREYRELLRGQWGIVDVQDCVAAAQALADQGRVDRERLLIRGGSAGGYTTLCALAFTDVFHAGASYYGVADIEALFADTHKFESRYDAALVPRDEARERSPIHAVDRITAPVIVLQGLEDAVVPPGQAETIVAALKERGVRHEYRAYEGESHGFRRAETIVDSLEAELAFYRSVLRIT